MRRFLSGAICFPLASCAGEQSMLDPHGGQAERIFDLTLVLFIGGALIFALVIVALAFAIGGPDRARGVLRNPSFVAWSGIAFPVVVLTALLAFGLWMMRKEIQPAGEAAHRIEVEGQQWWWRVTYIANGGRRIESANEIRVPVGREVEFVLTSPDVVHSFWVPSLGGKLDMIPGRINRLRLTAERPGVYRGQCAEYCGGPHALMSFEVIAMPPEEFDAWLARAAEPSALAGAEGGDIFAAAGCGSCHGILGTGSAGRVGPDLSRLGERRKMGAATVETTPDNIARFITDGQHIKPGNLMPEFRVLTPDELQSVSVYLAGLK